MKVVCSYCRESMGEKPPLDDVRTSHGICSPCEKLLERQLDGVPLDEYLSDFDSPVIVVRGDSRVIAMNAAMEQMVGRSRPEATGLLSGEAMECSFARLPEGCGKTVHCQTCTIRRAVTHTMETGEPVVRQSAWLQTNDGRINLRISSARIEDVVRVVIDEAEKAS